MSEMVKISTAKLSIDAAYELVQDPSCGGICLFVGTVRNVNKGKCVTHLDFEAYQEMAISEMNKIVQSCKEQMDIKNICIHHREGTVAIKEIAVIIAVSAIHREPAFEACKFAIDTLKETVPIWKKENLVDGSYWVGARP